MKLLIIFFVLSLINVLLQTTKSILTVKSTKFTASLVTAIAYAFYYVVLKQLTDFTIIETVVITIITNLIGVWLAMYLLDKFKKDQLWKITATVAVSEEGIFDERQFQLFGISYSKTLLENKKYRVYDFYCRSQKETALVKEVLKLTKAKYHYIVVNQL